MKSDFWAGKRVLLTGHTGFKGGWLSLWLQQMGAAVTGFALPPSSNPCLFSVLDLAETMPSVIGDIRDLRVVKNLIAQVEPEVVFHLAAQPLVRASYADPVETYTTNVLGTVNILEAVRMCDSVRCVINVTSDKAYENREWVWGYRETDPVGGHDPYSSSKGCAELVASAYRRSFGVPVASVRAGNVIGGGDWSPDRLLPDVLRALERGQPVEIRNPTAIRPWQHVLDPLRGYLVLAEKVVSDPKTFADSWNFGPDDVNCRPVSFVIDACMAAWGREVPQRVSVSGNPHEANLLKLDSSKARQALGWSPRLCLTKALDYTVGWHRAFVEGTDMRSFSLLQLKSYEAYE